MSSWISFSSTLFSKKHFYQISFSDDFQIVYIHSLFFLKIFLCQDFKNNGRSITDFVKKKNHFFCSMSKIFYSLLWFLWQNIETCCNQWIYWENNCKIVWKTLKWLITKVFFSCQPVFYIWIENGKKSQNLKPIWCSVMYLFDNYFEAFSRILKRVQGESYMVL